MYKVLIVDDEKHVVSLIKNLVDWAAFDMEVVGSAGNGKAGIELVRELKPDILIADVLMPGYDGITLMKKVREIDRDIKVIMISGHKRFEYAKSVIKYNVEDYLLKPIDKGELEALLDKIKKEISHRQQEREHKNRMYEQLGANKTLMNALFMENLVSGELFERKTDLERVNEMYFTDFEPGDYRCFILKLDQDGKADNGFEEDLLLSVNKEMTAILEEGSNAVLSFIDRHRIIFLIACAEGERSGVEALIKQAFSASEERISRHAGFRQTLGLGTWVRVADSMDGLRESVEIADQAVDARFSLGSWKIIDESALPQSDGALSSVLTNEALEELRSDIRSSNTELIRQRINALFGQARLHAQTDATIYTKLAWRINDELCRYVRLFEEGGESEAAIKKEMRKAIEGCATEQNLADVVAAHLIGTVEEAVGDNKGNLSPAVRVAKKFIKNNYAKNIGLNDVAQVVNLSPVYFSVLFKKETNANFVDYLNRVRIDAAKEMLREIKYNISEIAGGCGFSDYRYFSKIFKKIVGITPSDYRSRQIQ